MQKIRLICLFLMLWGSILSAAQEVDVRTEDVRIETRLDAFGVEVDVISGKIFNQGDSALTGINVYADLSNADGEIIGEGFGFMVDACGTALLEEALQPGDAQLFLANVDLFGEGAVEEIDISIEGTSIAAQDDVRPVLPAVSKVAGGEVVAVEWLDEATLRYGVGCDARVFTTYDWYQYDLTGYSAPLEAHPNAAYITDSFMAQTAINQLTQSREIDPTLFDRSFLTFPVQSKRIVYQSDIRTVITAERDGSFRRVIHELLHSYSLQGFLWTPAGNFLAYYYGAYGDPVRYFTASGSGGLISAVLTGNTPSDTVPGVYNDGQRVIIGGTFEDSSGEMVTGYWLSSTVSQNRELLFAVDELPGNNYPAPAYYRKDASTRYFYVIRPINGQAVLQCYFREADELLTLTELPLQLERDERAWSYLSPDFKTLALAANGTEGGLWLIHLDEFEACR